MTVHACTGAGASKYQVSIPKRLADQLGIAPGDDVEWSIAGDELRVSRPSTAALSLEEKLEMFDAATRRQAQRNRKARTRGTPPGRGWTREELYERDRSR